MIEHNKVFFNCIRNPTESLKQIFY